MQSWACRDCHSGSWQLRLVIGPAGSCVSACEYYPSTGMRMTTFLEISSPSIGHWTQGPTHAQLEFCHGIPRARGGFTNREGVVIPWYLGLVFFWKKDLFFFFYFINPFKTILFLWLMNLMTSGVCEPSALFINLLFIFMDIFIN